MVTSYEVRPGNGEGSILIVSGPIRKLVRQLLKRTRQQKNISPHLVCCQLL